MYEKLIAEARELCKMEPPKRMAQIPFIARSRTLIPKLCDALDFLTAPLEYQTRRYERQTKMAEEAAKQLTTSQQETRAAVADVEFLMRKTFDADACNLCANDETPQCRIKCTPPTCSPKWRGPQEAGEGEKG
jgi:hypothetical protein